VQHTHTHANTTVVVVVVVVVVVIIIIIIIIIVSKSGRMLWVDHEHALETREMNTKFWRENVKGENHLGIKRKRV
jgi:uncharacterized membrane protein YqiK